LVDVSACDTCGGALTDGRCLRCNDQRRFRYVHREVVLLALLIALTVGAFFFTRATAAGNSAMRLMDGSAWYEIAQQQLQQGRTQDATVSLRRATAKDLDNRQYRLALSSVLATDGRVDDARDVLLRLRELQPEDPETNLQLARLEARRGDESAAVRYYQNALTGLWNADQISAQRQVRIELIQFLLSHDQRSRALSELLVLSGALPDDPAAQVRVAQMFLRAEDAGRALDHFLQALRTMPADPEALAGAGEAAFASGDYPRARQYLAAAPGDVDRVRELRTLVNLVLSNDPLAPRLGLQERRRRLAAAFQQALETLDTCLERQPAAGPLDALRLEATTFEEQLTSKAGRDSPDTIEAGTDLVYRIERGAQGACGAPTPADQALLLIGRRHGFENQ
jgi:tetratricopeptide (TPR) repeat protein